MKLDSAACVAVVELVVFVPALVASIIVCARHGFARSAGWIYTSLLCVVRIGGAVCQLIARDHPSQGVITAALIFDSIGLSPLLLATLGLITRLTDRINAAGKQLLSTVQLRAIQLVILVATILSIVGGTSTRPDASGAITIPATVKAGVVLYLLAFLGVGLSLVLALPHRRILEPREGRVAVAVGLALPLIAVRILYSLVAAFANNKHFSIYGGSVGIRVGMATVEEFVVVVMYIALGFTLSNLNTFVPPPESATELGSRTGKLFNGDSRQRY
ncbi:hypothetical protein V2A60_004989 [Cordyceps javanica]